MRSITKKAYIYGLTSLALVSTGVSKAFALDANSFTLPGFGPNTSIKDGDAKDTVANLANTVINYILFAAGLTAVIIMLINGYKYLTAGGDSKKTTEARQGIINAVIGIVIIMAAFLIVRFAVGLGKNVQGGNTNPYGYSQ